MCSIKSLIDENLSLDGKIQWKRHMALFFWPPLWNLRPKEAKHFELVIKWTIINNKSCVGTNLSAEGLDWINAQNNQLSDADDEEHEERKLDFKAILIMCFVSSVGSWWSVGKKLLKDTYTFPFDAMVFFFGILLKSRQLKVSMKLITMFALAKMPPNYRPTIKDMYLLLRSLIIGGTAGCFFLQ